MRSSGILLPVASLPSKYGIGCFSKEAYEFVDFLQEAGQKKWQILPLGPTGYGDSPYQSFSTFAGNPYFIDLERLIEEGLLLKEECEACDFGDNEHYIDYKKIYDNRFRILRKAFTRANLNEQDGFLKFCRENAYWLEDYSLYMAVKNYFHGISWIEWEEDIRFHDPEAVKIYKKKLSGDIQFYQYLQYLFAKQWRELKDYANEKGIELIGDIPIYVAFDSSDTWANPKLFQLDADHLPKAVAGCPPDAFSATGQLWGNPLYDWEYHKKHNYDWWMKRLVYSFALYDVLRIDHFRGFDEYYAIPYGNKTAENGCWRKGPGYDLFCVMKERLGEQNIIAEDLGYLTPSVYKLMEKTGYPGMKVLEFAFDPKGDSVYLPHNYDRNCVVYTGTHDNQTLKSWYVELPENERKMVNKYLGFKKDSPNSICERLIRLALMSTADMAVIPIQDYLELEKEARINTPSTLGENWKWRVDAGMINNKLAKKLKELSWVYGRYAK